MFEEQSHEAMQQPIDEPQGRWTLPAPVRGFVAAILLAMAAVVIYGVHQHNSAAAAAQQAAQMSAALNETHSQIDSLNSKLNSMVEAQQQQAQREAERLQAQKKQAGHVAVVRRRADEARWKKLQAKLDETDKKIGDTQNDLNTAKTELGNSIARTHDELVVLQRKGERSYFEFDINKSKQYSKAGPVNVSLRKANTKHDYADLELLVDDAHVQQKHVNLYQPVMFYAGDAGAPLELVINSISKNHIHGYISAPKYRQSELAAMSSAAQQNGAQAQGQPAGTGDAATSKPSAARRKLTLPQD